MHMTDDKQIEFMKTNSTSQQGNYYDFHKTVDVDDLLKEYVKRYTTKTSKCLVSYFRRYAEIFFGLGPDNELLN